MKKHSANKLPTPSIHSIIATQKLMDAHKRSSKAAVIATTATATAIITTTTTTVPPPDEETLLQLNKIAKQSPFCFYYKGKSNDLL